MNDEENEAIERLLDPEASAAKQKTELKWIAEYLEESHILNLPPPKAIIRALETYSKRSKVDSSLNSRARNLIKNYSR